MICESTIHPGGITVARVGFAEIVAGAALVGSLAACGSSASTPTAAPAAGTSTEQAGPSASAAPTSALSTSAAASAQTPSTAPTAPTAKAPDPTKVVADSWLPASQFPLIGKMAWQLDPYHSATAGVAVNATMDEQAPYYACQPEQLTQAGVAGLQSRDYHLDPAPSPNNTQVQQIQLFFADSAAATAGLATIEGWHSGCAAGPSQKTASTAGGIAYLVVDRSDGTAYHEYFVQRGAVIASVVLTGYDVAAPSVKNTSQDKATLGAMTTRLCTYKSAC